MPLGAGHDTIKSADAQNRCRDSVLPASNHWQVTCRIGATHQLEVCVPEEIGSKISEEAVQPETADSSTDPLSDQEKAYLTLLFN